MDKKNNICILLSVWGEKYIKNFLDFSLPSLLAPGNIPAFAREYPTRFVMLSRSSDKNIFENNIIFQKIKNLVTVEFLYIDDLIVYGNYSTTLTLAYDRAIKQTGQAMLNTYFVFLTSDYVMADGSIEGLIKYIKNGFSGICSGNFQVIKEEIEPFLKPRIDLNTRILQIKPRDLLKEAFNHLHPISVASIYNQTIIHNYRGNRFFFRHDNQILAGRFYLLHMLCIKPETMDYQIGSSCDYSFIPGMCPSGNIAIINDSDEYLVIEIQSKLHELNFVNWGEYQIKKLIISLSEWTNKQHRENAKQSIYFHSREVTQAERESIENNLNHFTSSIAKGLEKYPAQPYKNHPYWIGAIKAFNQQKKIT